MKTNRSITLLILCLCPVMLVAQGLYWEQSVSMKMMGEGQEIRTKGYLLPMKLKSIGDDGNGVIIRADKEMIYMINDGDKTYSEMTFKEFEAQMSQLSEQMNKMQEEMKDMPAEQRRMLEGIMGGMKEYTIKKTGEKKKVIGYGCEKVLLLEDGKEIGEFWITKDVGSMKQFAKNWENLMEKMVRSPMAKMYRKLAELDGFVMESQISGTRSTTTKLEKRSIGAGEFEIPAGYKKVKMEPMDMNQDDN